MKWFRFAIRNVLRNRRRALVTIGIVAVGVAGILVSGGFALYTYDSLREMAARDDGHLILAHRNYFDSHENTPLQFGLAEYEKYTGRLLADDRVRAVLPKLHFSGLISNGDNSTVFVGQGISPREFRVKGPFLKILAGSTLSSIRQPGDDPRVMLGSGLAKAMHARPGDALTLLSSTVEGGLNAIDVVVQGVFTIGVPELDKRLLLLNIDEAQALLQTRRISTLSVYLQHTEETAAMAEETARRLPQLALHTWHDQATYYEAVRSLYNRIFGLLGAVILLMVLFAVSNTLSMAVVERTREIGTLRAIGTRPGEVVRNFILEALVMGGGGALIGMLAAAGISLFFAVNDFQMPPPPARSEGYPLVIYVHFPLYLATTAGVLLLSAAAAWRVSRRAAVKPIVEALSHV